MGAYIINVPSTVDRIIYVHVDANTGKTAVVSRQMEDLTPYTAPDLEQVRKEAYEQGQEDLRKSCVPKDEEAYGIGYNEGFQCGLDLAWDAARKIANTPYGEEEKVFGSDGWTFIVNHTAQEAIEKIRQYEREKEEVEERAQKEEEKSISAEEVMRQYLDEFCKGKRCHECVLYTPDFTCGRGYHFLNAHSHISDEEVRRAYAKVVKEKS